MRNEAIPEPLRTSWPKGPTRWIAGRVLMVSVPFTWNLGEVKSDLTQRSMEWDTALVGGPAVQLMPETFADMPWVAIGGVMQGVLQRVNPQATRTTVGCVNRCAFCAVPRVEPQWSELQDWPDLPVIMDNNLLAATQRHFDRVMDRLERHGWCDFNQGLDCRLMTDHHAERIGRVKGAIVRMALDSLSECGPWEGAFQKLRLAKVAKSRIRSYVLCGFNDTPTNAWGRCEFVESAGAMVLPQWFHALDATEANTVTEQQRARGWDNESRKRIMRHYYRHTDGNGSHG